MISPQNVKTRAKSKEDENYAFRRYLKMQADPLSWMNSFISSMFLSMIVASAVIAANGQGDGVNEQGKRYSEKGSADLKG